VSWCVQPPRPRCAREIDAAEQAIKRISELATGKNMSRIKVAQIPYFARYVAFRDRN
jgi:hypothetical protein